jgi:hypothetical protein
LLVPVVLKDELMVGLSVSWPGFAKNGWEAVWRCRSF